jgi:hypothetical protein
LALLSNPRSGHVDALTTPGRLLCLRHYRVASMGWAFVSRCDPCMVRYRESLRPHTGCIAPAGPCNCNVCVRQPPSLRDMASRTLFGLSLNPDRFEMTRDVTYSEFVHAVKSGWARASRCLPLTSLTYNSTPSTVSVPTAHTTSIATLHCLGLPPQPGRSRPKRRRSVSFTHSYTGIGVRSVKGHCSFQIYIAYI